MRIFIEIILILTAAMASYGIGRMIGYDDGRETGMDLAFGRMAEMFKRLKVKSAKLQKEFSELDGRYILYNELLMAVQTKHPGETRHQTALRHIAGSEKGGEQTESVSNGDKI